MKYNLTIDRKEAVARIAELTGEKPFYVGAPRFAYEIRGIILETNSSVVISESADLELLEKLISVGIIGANIQARFPMPQIPTLHSILATIHSKGRLVSKATGGDFYISDELMEHIKQCHIVADLLSTIESTEEGALRGISLTEDEIVFDGFPPTSDPIEVKAYEELASAIVGFCLCHRVSPKVVDETNEKFSFRIWLVRLGLNGANYKKEREIFYSRLTGHTAFRTEAVKERWMMKHQRKNLT